MKRWISIPASILAILAAGLLANCWILSRNYYFFWDDWDWLKYGAFHSYGQIFHFLPRQAYNDRPIGAIFIKMLYSSFGLDNVAHHAVLLGLHLINGVLVYFVMSRLAKLFGWSRRFSAFPLMAALMFVAWPTATQFIGWDAAVFDTLGAFFYLSFLSVYLKAKDGRYPVFDGLLTLALLFLALRTKEMTVGLPIIVLLLELALNYHGKAKRLLSREQLLLLAPLFVLVGIYLLAIVHGAIVHPGNYDANSPYYFSKNPLVALKNLPRYIALFFDFTQQQFGFTGHYRWALAWSAPVVAFSVAGAWQLLRKQQPLMLLMVASFAITQAPVLPLANVTHRLYLYMPSIWLSAMVGLTLAWVANFIDFRSLRTPLAIAALSAATFAAISSPTIQGNRGWFVNFLGAENRRAIESIYALPRPAHTQTIAVINVPDASLPIFPFMEHYGIVEPFQVVFDDDSLGGKVFPDISPESLERLDCPDCYIVDYNRANLRLISR